MPNSTQIVYLSKAQYAELITNQSITVNGVTVNYNENDIYVTPQAEPITDVKINGTSIGSNGVANIPLASNSTFGLVKFDVNNGVQIENGILRTVTASDLQIKAGTEYKRVLVPNTQHLATFYGLSKLAGVDLASQTVTVGIYPDTSKAAIQNMLGITDLLSTEESSTATAAHAANSTFMMNGKLHRATAAIAIGDAVEVGTNCEVVKADEVFVKKTDKATSTTPGLVRFATNAAYGIWYKNAPEDDVLRIACAGENEIKAGSSTYMPIVPAGQHKSIFYGLSKLAGVDLANETVTVGTYSESSKLAINNMLGAVSKDSLDNAGITARTYTTKFGGEFSVTTATSQDYISPYARASVTGRINKENMHRVTFNNTEYILRTRLWYRKQNTLKVYEYLGNLNLFISDISGVPGGTDNVPFCIISDLNDSNSIDILTSTAGTYTIKVEQINNTQKELPKSLIYGDSYPPIEKNNNGGTYNGFSIGVNELNNKRGTVAIGYGNKITNEFSYTFGLKNTALSTGGVLLGTSNVASGSNAIAIGESNNVGSSGRAIGTDLITSGSNMTAIGRYNVNANTSFPNYTANTQYNKGDFVVGKIVAQVSNNFTLMCIKDHLSANDPNLYNDIDPETQSVWGYWKLAPGTGDTLLALGNGSMSNARSNAMKVDWAGNLRINGDIFVNCNSDSTGGTKLPTDVQSNGTSILENGIANIPRANGNTYGVSLMATDAMVKAGTNYYSFLTPLRNHLTVFYGLSKLAGVDLANETVTVGTYPETSKEAIQTMLGTQAAIEVIRL